MHALRPFLQRRRWTILIAAAFVAVTSILAGIRFLSGRDSPESPIGSIGDYQHFFYAAEAVLRSENPYLIKTRYYGYLPLWALMQIPLVPLGLAWAGAAFAILNGFAVFAGVYWWSKEAVYRVARSMFEDAVKVEELTARYHGPVVLLTTLVTADKIRAVLRLGQTDAVILLAFYFAFKLLDRRTWLSGLALGFIAQFKFQSLVMIPYFIVRGMWRQLFWTTTWTVGLACSGSLIWGWKRNSEYLSIALGSILELLGIEREIVDGPALNPLTWWRSVSVPSVMARATQPLGEHQLIVAGALTLGIFSLCLVIAFMIYRRHGLGLFQTRKKGPTESDRSGLIELVEWCGLIVGALVFTPQTTARHMFVSIAIVALASAFICIAFRSRLKKLAWVLTAGLFSYAVCLIAVPVKSAGFMMTGTLLVLFFLVLNAGLMKLSEFIEESKAQGYDSAGPT